MSLFRDENPALGPTTQVKELSGYGAGTPVVNYFKPGTREIIDVPLLSASTTPANFWVYQGPFSSQFVGAHANFTVTSTSGTANLVKITADGIAPSTADNGTTVRNLLSAPMSLSGTANTRVNGSLNSAAAGSPLILNPGDQIAIQLGGTLTGLAGCNVQFELAQIG